MRRFSTELNQLEHIQSTCNFLILKMIVSDISDLLSRFSLSFCLSAFLGDPENAVVFTAALYTICKQPNVLHMVHFQIW